ncbi:LPS assembly lipoprotein LptE [Hydrotalea sp.]|uniref:LPS assembly lipoprotein LptE n=2 Tax=Hydrotalea sp. TaxID=2881279 RepID=UPI00260B0613|nr:LPS assembly lipoprotein LptE [Hydrotalea sp.]
MILKNKIILFLKSVRNSAPLSSMPPRSFAIVIFALSLLLGCKIYSFKDVSIDYSKIKTIKIGFIENRASYVNPQLSPQLTDKLQLKIASQTKLIRTNSDDANLVVSGYISDYSVSTAAISAQQASANRLTVSAHITVKNNVDNKTDEFDVSRNYDFSSNLSLQQAEGQLTTTIVSNISDDIFNHIFSNW